MSDTVTVTLAQAREAAVRTLKGIGWDEEDAETQADIMLYAERHGNNQGLIKLFDPTQMAPAPGCGKPRLSRSGPVSAVVDGQQSPGMLALNEAVAVAAEKARAQGVGIVGVNNTSTSSGMLAYYGASLAEQGLVCIIIATSPELVSMVPGAAKKFGTNPICFGIPREGGKPLVFDMSTSAVAFFGVMEAKAKGQQLAEGVACHADGTPTTDPDAILSQGASILPFGGHKGAALSLMAELLGSVLPGAAVLGMGPSKEAAKNWGHTVIAFDPQLLTDSFAAKVDAVLVDVKASGKHIRLPGEKSSSIAAAVAREQALTLPRSLWESLQRSSGKSKL